MRLFFALPADPAGQALPALLCEALRRGEGSRDLSWVPPGNLHLTLSFLGEVGATGLEAARGALAELPLPIGPIAFKPGSIAVFPARGAPRVLVVEASRAPEGLAALHAALCATLARASRTRGVPCLDPDWPDADLPGSRPRRPFRAHLTIARFRPAGSQLRPDRRSLERAGEALEASGSLALGPLTLFESRLSPSGASYRVLEVRRGAAATPGLDEGEQ
ncbi:MAG: 2'-5' RNA ligase family protein [Spirochaetota bacterium]